MGFSIGGAISSITGAVSSVVGSVKGAFGKIMTPIAKLPGMAELTKALPKELGPILKIMEYLPIPMTQAVAIIVMIARYAQKAAELRRDFDAAENFKRQIAAAEKQAKEQNVEPVEMSPSEFLSILEERREEDVAELGKIQARKTAGVGALTFGIRSKTTATRDATRTADRTSPRTSAFITSGLSTRMAASKDDAREKELKGEIAEIDKAAALVREMQASPAAPAMGESASVLPKILLAAGVATLLYVIFKPKPIRKVRYA